jgi:hypothetical protein
LTGYFLADDFGIARYAHDILSGHVELLIHNWIGNFNSVPGMAVYRPWQIISWLTDVALWKGNASGYYATNLLYYTGDTLLLFAVCRQFTRRWNSVRSFTASLLAAALFAVNPLHCESVSWAIGRVDIECCFYYLVGLNSYLMYRSSRRPLWLALATLGFWLGMFVKEMAIGLPVLTFAISFLGLNGSSEADEDPKASLKARLIYALKESAPIWVNTFIYFGIRYLALGTLAGGYTGAIGDGQADSAFHRWLDPDTYQRVFLPFAVSLFHPDNLWRTLLQSCYVAMLTILVLKALRKEIPAALGIFCLIWIGTCALPIYKLWGIGMDLEGARFCYFLTMAFSATAPMLLLAPESNTASDASAPVKPASSPAFMISSVAIILAVFCLYKACLRTNATWVHAGKEVRAVIQSGADIARRTAPQHKILVLGIPKRNVAAHMIYNGATFRLGLCPPISTEDHSNVFITFDPITYGPGEFINSARLKSYLADPQYEGPYVWNSKQSRFTLCKFPAGISTPQVVALTGTNQSSPVQAYSEGHSDVKFSGGIFSFRNTLPGDGLQFNGLNLDARSIDFLQFEYKIPGSSTTHVSFGASWKGSNTGDGATPPHAVSLSAGNPTPDGFRMVRIPLSHHWRWFTEGPITALYLLLPAVPSVEVRNVAVLSGQTLRPTLVSSEVPDDGSGVFYVTEKAKFHIDAASIPHAAKLLIECSKPDYYFDQIDPDKQDSAVAKTFVIDGKSFDGSLPSDFTPRGNYCEVRTRALDSSGTPLGEYSEPLIISRH